MSRPGPGAGPGSGSRSGRADVEGLLARAAPRVARGDEGAARLRSKLVALARQAWARGPRRLERLGVEADGPLPALPPEPAGDADPDGERAALEAIRAALGDDGFVTLFEALRRDLARRLAERRGPAERRGLTGGGRPGEAPERGRPAGGRPRGDAAPHAGADRPRPHASAARPRSPAGGEQAGPPARDPLASSAGPDEASDEGPALEVPDDLLEGPLGVAAGGAAGGDEGPLGLRFDDDDGPAPGGAPGPGDERPLGLRFDDDDGPAPGGAPGPGDERPLGLRFDDEDGPVLALAGAGARAASARGGGEGEAPDVGQDAGQDSGDDEGEDDGPAQAADRALRRFLATGDDDELARARRLHAQAAKAARAAGAAFEEGAARAGLARALLLAGQADEAAAMAEKALARFPGEPVALVASLEARREHAGLRARVAAALRRADRALAQGDLAAAAAEAVALDALAPGGPLAPLVQLAVAHERGGGDPAPAIAAAWARYPAPPHLADLALGQAVEAAVCRACLAWLRGRIEREGGPVLARTIEGAEDRANEVAGAWQLALGVACAALARGEDLAPRDLQERWKWVGQALLAAQHVDHAAEVLAHARRLDRDGPHALELHRDEQACGVLRRGFDRPGVKVRTGKLDGLGLAAYRKAIAWRLEQVLAQRDAAAGALRAAEDAAVAALAADPDRRARVSARARDLDAPDPLARLAEVEAQLAGLEGGAADLAPGAPGDDPAAGGPEAPAAGKLGVFGRWKAGLGKALDKAKAAAKGAEVAVRRAVLDGKRKEALVALGRALCDPPEGGWDDPDLDALVARAETTAATVEHLDDEAAALRRLAGRATSSPP